MFPKTLFLTLGLVAAVMIGCEKKEEAPAVPTQAEVDDATADMEQDVDTALEEGNDKMGEAVEAVEDAAEEVKDAAEEVKDAAEKIEIPGQ